MSDNQNLEKDNISRILSDPGKVTQIIQAGINEALLKHKRMGNPVCGLRDNKIVWIPADKIQIDEK